MAGLVAGKVPLLDELKDPLTGIKQKRQGSLDSALGKISNRSKISATSIGRPQGEYAGFSMGQAGEMGSRGIDDALLGVAGTGSYNDVLAEQDYQRNLALADELGSLNSPSTFEEIMGGLSGAGNAAGKFGGLYKALSKRSRGGSPLALADDYWRNA